MDLTGKIILITGATSGIGEALTAELSKYDCKIAALGRNEEKLALIKKTSPGKIYPFKFDITEFNKIPELYKQIKTKLGMPDIIILNAGISNKNSVENFDLAGSLKVVETNFSSNVVWIKTLLPDLLDKKPGIIAGVSSLADNRAYSLSSVYSATKAAFTNFLEGLSVELKKSNIKIITVRPGFVKSGITDKNEFNMPMLMEPIDAAKIIIKGIIKEKRYIQFPLPIYLLTRIMSFLPNSIFEIFFSKLSRRK